MSVYLQPWNVQMEYSSNWSRECGVMATAADEGATYSGCNHATHECAGLFDP